VTKEFPDLNVLMNNAGVMRAINFHDRGDDLFLDITREIDINLSGPIRMVKRFLPLVENDHVAEFKKLGRILTVNCTPEESAE
jgi:short-subunit dehydrogenase involved in D-alanine esterification of teichoic acids